MRNPKENASGTSTGKTHRKMFNGNPGESS
jgi:hypothetical protein